MPRVGASEGRVWARSKDGAKPAQPLLSWDILTPTLTLGSYWSSSPPQPPSCWAQQSLQAGGMRAAAPTPPAGRPAVVDIWLPDQSDLELYDGRLT
jgi:hypothetical protein